LKKLIAITALACLASVAQGIEFIDIYKTIKEYNSSTDIHVYDQRYQSANRDKLVQIINDHEKLMRKYTKPTFLPQKFDCDDYAFTFKAIASWHSLMRNSNYLCGVITVKQEKAFAGIPAGGYHALNIMLIDGALLVIEPQTYGFIPLSEYPNRNRINGLFL
tara:strand:+ start:273 stop:758 length:486 start_codon:yes stop_codon:yes gene_type:complete